MTVAKIETESKFDVAWVFSRRELYVAAKGDGGGGDNWSYKICKAPVSCYHLQTNAQLFTAGCPSCHPANSIKVLCACVCVCVCQQIQYADLDFIHSTASEIRSIERSALPVRSGGNDSTEYDEVDAIKTQALISAITSREIDAIVPPSDDC